MSSFQPAKPVATKSQKFIRVFILLLGSVILLSYAVAHPVLHHYRKTDFLGRPEQTDSATVVMLVQAQTHEEGQTSQAYANVRFHGHLYTASKVFDIQQLRVGQSAQITYRVGKSGAILIDSVAPLSFRESAP